MTNWWLVEVYAASHDLSAYQLTDRWVSSSFHRRAASTELLALELELNCNLGQRRASAASRSFHRHLLEAVVGVPVVERSTHTPIARSAVYISSVFRTSGSVPVSISTSKPTQGARCRRMTEKREARDRLNFAKERLAVDSSLVCGCEAKAPVKPDIDEVNRFYSAIHQYTWQITHLSICPSPSPRPLGTSSSTRPTRLLRIFNNQMHNHIIDKTRNSNNAEKTITNLLDQHQHLLLVPKRSTICNPSQ
ncbi:hypothetical protein G7K_6814-t1 [Saitoella complicata NRRL Y-17804]|uniref:Uncharacterized protein n=1 Tax=Saitoella complicata (strain BCRC 22490 / CBS 7301 / JCM 7358 / NBRC 10748 / NRRL Y-17804) TaxID=698492 RepID=A0A0E9NTL3_SAICN|nr:hypothetical protein G7K_6814-t1 [Saitoella complicata NRRL Y-17804]